VHIASAHFTDSKAPNIQDDVAEKLYKKLFQKVVQNRQKLFLLSASKAARDPRIQKLWHYRFIHLVVPAYTVITDSGDPEDYSVFSMDYGRLVALKTHKAGEQVVSLIQAASQSGFTRFFIGSSLVSLVGTSLKTGGLKEKLISVAGRRIVGTVETADLDSENLLKTCVYDNLL